MFEHHLLSALLCAPLAGAVVLLLTRSRDARLHLWITALTGTAELIASLLLWVRYEPQGPTWQLVERVPVIASIGAGYAVGVDGVSVIFVLLAALTGLVATLSSWRATGERSWQYFACLLVLQVGAIGTFIALDLVLFVLSWEAALLSAAALIRVWGGAGRLAAARRFVAMTQIGTAALILGILGLYFYG